MEGGCGLCDFNHACCSNRLNGSAFPSFHEKETGIQEFHYYPTEVKISKLLQVTKNIPVKGAFKSWKIVSFPVSMHSRLVQNITASDIGIFGVFCVSLMGIIRGSR